MQTGGRRQATQQASQAITSYREEEGADHTMGYLASYLASPIPPVFLRVCLFYCATDRKDAIITS